MLEERILAARVIGAVSDGLRRSPSPYTFATLTNDGKVHPSHTFYDRLSSVASNAVLHSDLYSVLAYSVRENADGSFTVYGGTTPVVTMNRAEAANALAGNDS